MSVLTLWVISVWLVTFLVMVLSFVTAQEMDDDGRD